MRYLLFLLFMAQSAYPMAVDEMLSDLLYRACINGNKETALDCFALGVDINCEAPEWCKLNPGATPLLAACIHNRADMVSLLLEQGAQTDKSTEEGAFPLFIASAKGNTTIMRHLLDANADPNYGDDRGITSLEAACLKEQLDATRMLIEAGADVNGSPNSKRSPLVAATFRGIYPLVKLLLDSKADPNKKVERGFNALAIAVQMGHKKIIKLLQSHGAQDTTADSGVSEEEFKAILEQSLLEHGIDDIEPYLDGLREEGLIPQPGQNVSIDNVAERIATSENRDPKILEYLKRFCNSCQHRGEGLKLCADCRSVFYCSKTCQKKDWKAHREACQASKNIT